MIFLPLYNSDSRRIAQEFTDAGHQGMDIISDTAPHTAPGGQYTKFIALAAAVGNLIPFPVTPATRGATGGQVNGIPNLTAVPLPVGVPVTGNFSGIQLASGTVMAFYGS